MLTLSLLASSSWIRPPNLLLLLHKPQAPAEADPALLQHQHQLHLAGHRVSTSADSWVQTSWGSAGRAAVGCACVSDPLCGVAEGTGVCRNRAGGGEPQGERACTGTARDALVGMPRDVPAGVKEAGWEKGWESGKSQPAAGSASA